MGVTDAANPSDNGYSDEGFDIILSDSGSDIHNYQNTSYSLNGAGQLTGTWAPDGRDSNPQSVQETDPRNNLLDAFDGSAADGTWTLLVEDQSAGDYGVLDGWSLDVTGTTAVPEPDGGHSPGRVLSGSVVAAGQDSRIGLIIGIARPQHGCEAGGFLLPAFADAGLFEVSMQADLNHGLLANHFLLEPPQSLFHGLSFS